MQHTGAGASDAPRQAAPVHDGATGDQCVFVFCVCLFVICVRSHTPTPASQHAAYWCWASDAPRQAAPVHDGAAGDQGVCLYFMCVFLHANASTCT